MRKPFSNIWADRIHTALEATADAFRALHDARFESRPFSEIAELKRAAYAAVERSNALQAQCREQFAASRGWRWNRKAKTLLDPFTYARNGARFLDHEEFFDSIDQKRVALVTHSYAPAQELADYGARHNYTTELLPFSWWNPSGCQAVVFTRKIGAEWPQ